MVHIIDELVTKKLLKRTVNPKDRREYSVELTAKAKKIMPEIHKGIEGLNKNAMQGLTKQQIELFFYAINKMSANLHQIPANRIIVNYKKAKATKK